MFHRQFSDATGVFFNSIQFNSIQFNSVPFNSDTVYSELAQTSQAKGSAPLECPHSRYQ